MSAPVMLAHPFRGRWRVQNSPADGVASHGTSLFALDHFLALCHLRRGSIAVRPGQRVEVGERLGACGNSGNSTEPHLHLQAMTSADPSRARPLPITFPGGLPRTGELLDIC